MGKSIKYLLFFSIFLFSFFPMIAHASHPAHKKAVCLNEVTIHHNELLLSDFVFATGEHISKYKLSFTSPTNPPSQSELKLSFIVNDKLYENKDSLRILDHTTYISLDDFTSAIGANLVTDEITHIHTIHKGNNKVNINENTNTYEIVQTKLKGPIKVIDHVIYIPIKTFSKNFGFRFYDLSKNSAFRILDGSQKISNVDFFKINKTASTKEKTISPTVQPKTTPVIKKETPKKKKVYLTFDDGPNVHTSKILNLLKSKKAKATFFVIEPNMRKFSGTVKQMVAEGHYIGLHSVSHDKNKLYGKPQNVVNEMEQTRKTLYSITKLDSHLVRVPYGSKPYMTDSFRNGLVNQHFKMWDWNIDTFDWKYPNNPNEIIRNVKTGINTKKNQDKIVILMHDSEKTLTYLPTIVDYLVNQGYSLEAYNPKEHFSVNFWKDERL
ncbi:polysaccharide deacetylase family protein [Peribacillus alkalitolerans]|uniref:polysaccharide deacetylase family protein n=1 Tax=Peribacillus alkalitolerans TaxID=1550385 RepID=UPI0013D48F22|nr:polysaccharide deacetylase family protein [Peribacillus alkalitolerans]